MTTGFLSPLLIPVVTNSNLSVVWKSGLSGALAFGIPEIFLLLAIAIMGKKGYELIKSKIIRFIKPIAPSQTVSRTRYRIGLFFFCVPLILGWILPYLIEYINLFGEKPVIYYVISDSIFFSSFFILGGDFWHKFSGLFSYNVKVIIPENK